MNTSGLKKYYIKMIQTLKHNYFVDDECRKIYLQAQFGKDSLKELSIEELRAVLEIVGYGKCQIEYLGGKFRYEILLRSNSHTMLLKAANLCKSELSDIDIDPVNFS